MTSTLVKMVCLIPDDTDRMLNPERACHVVDPAFHLPRLNGGVNLLSCI